MLNSNLVLVIDDDAAIREFITMALTDEGYEVVAVDEGRPALEVLNERQPSLILLDMMMPFMDGKMFIEAYHQTPAPHAPVIVLTANRDAAQTVPTMGAANYLAKPFDLNELIGLVGKYTGR